MRRPVAKGDKRNPTGGAHDTPPDLLLGADGRKEQGAMAPKPWIKKLKLSCHITHIDALAVAVMTIKQLINIAALHHLRHITTQKVFSFRGP